MLEEWDRPLILNEAPGFKIVRNSANTKKGGELIQYRVNNKNVEYEDLLVFKSYIKSNFYMQLQWKM